MAHSPGPWQVYEPESEFYGYEVRTTTDQDLIAEGVCGDDVYLIAEAPGLLAALTALLDAAKNGANLERHYDDEIDALWDEAEASIRRATKETP